MGASETSTVLAGLAEAFGLPFNLVDPLLKIHDRATKRYDHQPESLVVADLPGGTIANDLLNAERPRPRGGSGEPLAALANRLSGGLQ